MDSQYMFEKGYAKGYNNGRTDAIEELIKLAHEDVTTGNMIISLADVAEQLKEQSND